MCVQAACDTPIAGVAWCVLIKDRGRIVYHLNSTTPLRMIPTAFAVELRSVVPPSPSISGYAGIDVFVGLCCAGRQVQVHTAENRVGKRKYFFFFAEPSRARAAADSKKFLRS